MRYPDPWPLGHLVLRTPRLELRPDDDAGLIELVDEAHHGVHPPERMPFGFAWTDVPADELGGNVMRYHWDCRAELRRQRWQVNFLVRLDGRVVGTQGLRGSDFAVTRECATGSWIGMRHQGNGIGTEMRAAVLAFAFDHLGATQARSGAWEDNAASLAVSRKLGYLPDGTHRGVRRDQPATEMRLLLTAERFAACRPEWTLQVDGAKPVVAMLGG